MLESLRAFVASPLEVLGFVTALAGVWLAARQKIATWPVMLVSIVAYAVFFYRIQLLADAALQGFFFVTSVMGWYLWAKGGPAHDRLPVSTAPRRLYALGLLAVAAVSLGWGHLLATYTSAAAPYVDATLAGGSVVAQVLQMRKKLECWVLWIVVDVGYVGLYVVKAAYLTAILYLLFLGLAASGYVQWRRSLAAAS